MSGDYSQGISGPDGRFTLNGLTPGGQYVVYADAVRSRNSYPTVSPVILPGTEEFYNGVNESGNGLKDDPCSSTAITAVPGQSSDASISFNAVKNGPSLITFGQGSNLTDISGDGTIAVGLGIGQPSASFRWTKETGIVNIGGNGGITRISPEGTHIVGSVSSGSAFWTGGTAWNPIPLASTGVPCPASGMATAGVSSGGAAVAGSVNAGACGTQRAALWTAATGTVVLPVPAGTSISRANHISADGNTVVGRYSKPNPGGFSNAGAIWVNGQFISIYSPEQPTIGEAHAVSADGSVVFGQGMGSDRSAWRWTQAGGIQRIGVLPGFTANPLDASDNGNVLVGTHTALTTRVPFIWIQQLGMVNLHDFVQAQGTYLGPYLLSTPTAVSGNGSVVAGWSLFDFTSWVLDMKKVVITHAPPGNPTKTKTLVVGFDSLADHLNHGDTIGITYRNN